MGPSAAPVLSRTRSTVAQLEPPEITHSVDPIPRCFVAGHTAGKSWTPLHFPPLIHPFQRTLSQLPSSSPSPSRFRFDSMVERDITFLHKGRFNPRSIQETRRPLEYRSPHLTITEWLERRGAEEKEEQGLWGYWGAYTPHGSQSSFLNPMWVSRWVTGGLYIR